ncbi:M16 family metallopeptidase [Oceanicella actignis]|uniref:Predicted Zn-dependent peptidase n=1 Tax=Oceanicella actignis TaxID=1189325 RepID=A0A1M7T900_9RHOB|nr:pitrilysin family protein [Oceanicella actignis]TYO89116.1 putative Zn-dependent peptidase [Oceanicella actignis]SET50251.1 Predicted Zn-dependent peptidase [Oceanicella actignis]SHN67234.1 Predicted Zn-dependent peptidase [Oceanicella actignis]
MTEIRLHTLPNGMRVITERMPGLASAALGVWVAAGARHEDEPENGLAHFLEHMAFKGTGTRSAAQIAETIENVGGYLNAYTSRETTAYYARVLAEDVPLAMELIADILLDSVFAEEDIEVERGVILQEIGQALDTPDDIIFDWLQEAAFPGQPIGRPILGPAERVRAFGREDLRRFVARHYAPDRMILAAAGAVDHDRLAAQAEALFGALPARAAPPVAPARFVGGEHRVEKPLEQAHFALALPAPAYRDPDFHAGQVLATLLGGGMSSRLFQEAREKRGLCYTIFAQASAYEDAGAMTIYAGASAEQLAELAVLVADELRRAARDIDEEETARARAQLKAGLVMGLESAFGRCERLARTLQIHGRAPDLQDTIARIDAVDAAAARAAARKLAQSEALAAALYGPVADAPDIEALKSRMAA